MAFLSQDSDTARTSRLAECAKAANKNKLRVGRRSKIRVRLKAIRTGCLVRSEQRVKGADFWARKNRFKAKCTDKGLVGC